MPNAPGLVDSSPLYALFDRNDAFSTDASLVALSERLRCTDVATTDQRDFSVYRPAHVERLANPIPLVG